MAKMGSKQMNFLSLKDDFDEFMEKSEAEKIIK